MKCMDPILCYTSNKRRQFRHFSLANPVFKLSAQQVFNCRTCIICRQKRSRELAIRCVLHASLYEKNCFLTLTYDESQPGYHNNLDYTHIQKFKKRLRRHCEYHFKRKVQIFNVHEYGKNGKKHWHLVCFNHDFSDRTLFTTKNGNNLFTSKTLQRLWPYGHHTIGDVTEASAMYQAQYTQKDFKNGNITNGKKSYSKHSGIGRDYFLKYYDQILRLGYVPFDGQKIPIPRYFRKIAHKHFSHYHEPGNFFDTPYRKALYKPFSEKNPPIREISDCYEIYNSQQSSYLDEIQSEWDAFIEHNAFNKQDPDFKKSGDNFLYDLNNKKNNQNF